jgi:hypothetical protein
VRAEGIHCLAVDGDGASPCGRLRIGPHRSIVVSIFDIDEGPNDGETPALEVDVRVSISGQVLPGRRVSNLVDRRQRARLYEAVLREGGPADITAFIDGALLIDLWTELVLPRDVRKAWTPVISAALRDAASPPPSGPMHQNKPLTR